MTKTTLEPIHVGDARTLSVTVTTSAGAPYNLTGIGIAFSMALVPDGPPALEKFNTAAGGGDGQIEVTNAAGGLCNVYLVSADTAPLPVVSKYYWDLVIQDADAKEYTVAEGTVMVVGRVTDPIP